MQIRMNLLWTGFIRFLIGLLLFLLLFLLFLSVNPRALNAIMTRLPLPGVVRIPEIGPTPLPPVVNAPEGSVPGGYVAFSGVSGEIEFACGFLLRLDDGRHIGVSTAHATPPLPPAMPAEFRSPGGVRLATLKGQIGRGREFYQDHFTLDYTFWRVEDDIAAERYLLPDPRGAGQPGEKILVYGRFENGAGGSRSWPGVILKVKKEATWIQLEESFYPVGFSGCPVISQYTGRVIGMAVAGKDLPPVVMGVHPIGSIVEKAEKVLAGQ